MTDKKIQPKLNKRPEQKMPQQVKLEQAAQQAPKSQVSSAVQPGQRATPGRKPLFRN